MGEQKAKHIAYDLASNDNWRKNVFIKYGTKAISCLETEIHVTKKMLAIQKYKGVNNTKSHRNKKLSEFGFLFIFNVKD